MHAIVAIFVYIISFFGLMDIWEKSLHFQHASIGPPPLLLNIFVTGVLIPFILGFICAVILNPKEMLGYWPVLVAPFLTLALRLLLDDVAPPWLLRNILFLLLGVVSSALIALFGAFFYVKLLK